MEVTRKVIRVLRDCKDRDLCLWLIPRKDGRVRKIKLGLVHALGGVCALSLVSMGIIYIGLDYSKFVSARSSIDKMMKRAKAQPQSSENYEDNLLAQLKFLADEHKKSKQYETQIRQRLSALKAALESGMPKELFEPLSDDSDNSDIGGAELDCDAQSSKGLTCLPKIDEVKAQLNWDISKLANNSNNKNSSELLLTMDRYIEVLGRMPIVKPVLGWVNSNFGIRISPFSKKIKKHQGLDFSVPMNSAIYATADGVVKSVGKTGTYGLVIDIEHSNRVMTRFAHLSRASVKKGDKVCRGEIIGMSGSTGRSTGPHLHYEIRVDKKPVDPKLFLGIGAVISPELFAID